MLTLLVLLKALHSYSVFLHAVKNNILFLFSRHVFNNNGALQFFYLCSFQITTLIRTISLFHVVPAGYIQNFVSQNSNRLYQFVKILSLSIYHGHTIANDVCKLYFRNKSMLVVVRMRGECL